MAAIPDAGDARSASRVVWRTLLRVVLFSGLTVVAWLLGAGTSHADEDLGLPGPGLIHVVDAVSADDGSHDDGSDDGLGAPAAIAPVVAKVLSSAPVSRLPVQPPAQVSALRPVVQAIGLAIPLDQVRPVSRPLSLPAQHTAPAQRPAAVAPTALTGKPVPVPAATAATAGKAAAPAARTPVVDAAPTVVCAPARPAAEPVSIQPAVLGSAPASPLPASPPGSATSLCAIGAATGGAGSKNGPDVAVPDGWVPDDLAQPKDLLDRDTSELPRSLSVQPSTSPD